MEHEYVQVTTTTDNRDAALELARSVVRERLAACAQVTGPITSAYWWDGDVQVDDEWLVLVKTRTDRYAALQEHIVERHDYDVPEVVATPITEGNPDYLSWLTTETRPAHG